MSGADAVEAALAALREAYAAELPGLVRSLVARIEEARTRPEAAKEAQREAHRLRGTAGSYGFADLGEVAGRIEDALEAGGPVPAELVGELLALAGGESP